MCWAGRVLLMGGMESYGMVISAGSLRCQNTVYIPWNKITKFEINLFTDVRYYDIRL